VVIDTTHLTFDEQVEKILNLAASKWVEKHKELRTKKGNNE
jgi:hypothetical protein